MTSPFPAPKEERKQTRNVEWIAGVTVVVVALAALDVYLFNTTSGDVVLFVLFPSFPVALFLGIGALLVGGRYRRTVRAMAFFSGWLLFHIGTLEFIRCCGAWFPSSFGSFNLDGVFYSFAVGGITAVIGFATTLLSTRRSGAYRPGPSINEP